MSERVVPRPAVVSAAVSEVILVAEDVVGVAQLALLAEVHVLGPVLADGQPPPRGQAAHQVVLVVCREESSSVHARLRCLARVMGETDGQRPTGVFRRRFRVPGFDYQREGSLREEKRGKGVSISFLTSHFEKE